MSSYTVFTGRWTDWSKGKVLGDQVTMSNMDGNILIAFIAVLNAFVGAVVWKALAYCLHQALATRAPRDGLHHQHQVMLRSSESSASFALKIATSSWAWRNRVNWKSLISRALLLAAPAIIVFIGFTVLSVFLSKIANVGDVLLKPQYCGVFDQESLFSADLEAQGAFVTAVAQDLNRGITVSYAYSLNCYGISRLAFGNSSYDFNTPASDCDFFVKPRINWTTTVSAECPFQDGTCSVPNSEIVSFDTGYVSSHTDLGVNAKEEDRIEFRQVTTCSPIATEKFMVNNLMDASIPAENRTVNYYFGTDGLPTFSYSYASMIARDTPYILDIATDRVSNPLSSVVYTFNDTLVKTTRAQASISLFFLASQADYFGLPVTDPWFNSTYLLPDVYPTYPGVHFFGQNNVGNVVGCATTYEVCNIGVSPRKCMPANDFDNRAQEFDWSPIALNEIQSSTANGMTQTLYSTGASRIASSLGNKALSASEYLVGYPGTAHVSMPLPDGQWRVEMERLQATSMAVLQRGVWAGITAFDADPKIKPFVKTANLTMGASYICANQKIHSAGHTSFTVLSLALIFTLDLVITIVGATITIIIPRIQSRYQAGDYRRRAWAANSPMQMQRGLYQLVGYGDWEGSMFDTPLTKKNNMFSGFHDIEELEKTISVDEVYEYMQKQSSQSSISE